MFLLFVLAHKKLKERWFNMTIPFVSTPNYTASNGNRLSALLLTPLYRAVLEAKAKLKKGWWGLIVGGRIRAVRGQE